MKALLKNKYVKISLKILAAFIILNIVLLSIAALYIHFHKDEIIAEVRAQISRAVNGEAQINDVDISLLSNFPNIGIKLKGVSILDSQYHTPLLQAAEISVGVSIFQLLKSNKKIARITVSNASVHLFTDSSGYSNGYLLKKKDTLSKTTSLVVIKRIELGRVNVLVEDALKGKKFEFSVSDLRAAIIAHDSLWDITMNENILVKGLAFNVPKGSYLSDQPVSSNLWKLQFNTVSKELNFDKSKVDIDHHPYLLSGKFHFKDSSFFQMHVQTENIPLMQAEQILTKKIRQTLSLIDLKKAINVQADLSGSLEKRGDPFVTANIQVKENEITTIVTSFTNCSFEGVYNNHISPLLPPSDENTNLLFTSFVANWNGIALHSDSILIKDITDPKLSFSLLSHCSLTDLDNSLALNTIRLEDGTADIAIKYNGPLIADSSLLSKFDVHFILNNGKALYEPRNIRFSNCSGEIDVAENTLTVNKLVCDVGKNHFEVNAAGSNLAGLAIADSSKAYLSLDAKSPSINLADFVSLFGSQNQVKSTRKKNQGLAVIASKIDDVLEKGDIEMHIKIGHIINHHFNADNINASLLFAKDNWQVQQASLQHAGGNLSLRAAIRETKDNYHAATATIKLSNVDVSKVFYAFNNFGLEAITDKNIHGILTSDADLTMGLNNNGNIIPGSMSGIVDFSIKKGALINYKPLLQIQDYILKDRDLTNVTFAELKDRLIIRKDTVYINRMEIASNAVRLFVEGYYGITGNTDISIQVPFSNFLKKNNGDSPQNNGVDSKAGPSIYLRAKSGVNGKVKVGLDLFGHKKNKKEI